MYKKKHLQFSALRKLVSKWVREIDDARAPGKVKHDSHDCCLSALAMMFFQDPSINKFQLRLQKKLHKDNLETLFKVNTIPEETQKWKNDLLPPGISCCNRQPRYNGKTCLIM